MKKLQARNSKIILIGLDGATFDLLKPLINENKLPNLKKLILAGAAGKLQSTIPCTTPVAWSTVYTGKNPGGHGIFDFRESYHRDQQRTLISQDSINGAKIWQILNNHNKMTILLNLPMTYPPEPVDGLMISGMMTPSKDSAFTYPPEFKDELLSVIPDYSINIDIPKYDTTYKEDCLKFLGELQKSFEKRKELLRYLITNKEWDFLFAVFILPDRIQHLFWKYLDPADDSFRKTRDGGIIYDRIIELYQLQDEMLGEINALLGKDDYLFIISDHGFGGTKAYINVNKLLEDWGYLRLKKRANFNRAFFKLWDFGDSRIGKIIVPKFVQRFIRRAIRKTRGSFKTDVEKHIEFTHTKAFFASIPSQGIYVTANGAEYDSVRSDIKHKLLELRDEKTGKKIVDRVYFREELYSGPFVKDAPDIIFVANNYAYLGRQHIGSDQAITHCADKPIGFHRPNGIFVSRGPDIRVNTCFDGLSLQDIAPTILYSIDLPIPQDMDGKVFTQIFVSERTAESPVLTESNTDSSVHTAKVYSSEDSREIKRRLKSLGYIE
ncbi:MAG: hypothetical protein GF315_00730 [candidate division Zixibacteria bacterium]|nr:hypothetical protein [candidate division Zixibacteria bacterium]